MARKKSRDKAAARIDAVRHKDKRTPNAIAVGIPAKVIRYR
jgi:acetyltransferase-like isoleucine patch superfamily enzyme